MIALLIITELIIIAFMIQKQIDSGKIINIAGKQRMLSQRIALLSNNYLAQLQKLEIKEKIQSTVEHFKQNHQYIKNIKSNSVNTVFYDPRYQYDNLFEQYNDNVLKFVNNPTEQSLKIINFTNESLLTTADILVTLLARENDSNTDNIIYFLIIGAFFIFILLYLLYNKITLVSVVAAEKNLNDLEQQKSFMSNVLENSAHSIITTDLNGTITLFNRKAEEMLGYRANEVVLKQSPALFHKEEEIIEKAKQLSDKFGVEIKPGFEVFVEKSKRGLSNKNEWTYIHKDQSEILVKLSVTSLKNSDNIITGYLGIAEDITALKIDEMNLKKYVKLINKHIITSSTDLTGKIIYTSQAFCDISGYTKEELIGKNHNIVRHPDMPIELYQELWESLLNNQPWSGEIKNLKKDDSSYWVQAYISPTYDLYGNKTGYTAIRQDITDKKLIEKISITDGLTDIYNRRHFDKIFPSMLAINARNKKYISFLLMDVDHFKQYNDTYGHQKGDDALINIAKTLKASLKRQDDHCFRLGGEEFGTVFYSDSKKKAFQYAHEIKEKIEGLKIEHSGNSASKYVTASMGLLCLEPNQVMNEDVIYRDTDKLLYQAKEQGRNTVITKDM